MQRAQNVSRARRVPLDVDFEPLLVVLFLVLDHPNDTDAENTLGDMLASSFAHVMDAMAAPHLRALSDEPFLVQLAAAVFHLDTWQHFARRSNAPIVRLFETFVMAHIFDRAPRPAAARPSTPAAGQRPAASPRTDVARCSEADARRSTSTAAAQQRPGEEQRAAATFAALRTATETLASATEALRSATEALRLEGDLPRAGAAALGETGAFSVGAGGAEDADCALCLCPLRRRGEGGLVRTGCAHLFHRACLDDVRAHGSDECPMCRTKL